MDRPGITKPGHCGLCRHSGNWRSLDMETAVICHNGSITTLNSDQAIVELTFGDPAEENPVPRLGQFSSLYQQF
ncbi:unnamed protein product [Pieris macdunnoughi]|uniref:Uncharacterized protein n=1 Tax=Pieris macdunnoughi TaxID=345717 RepID=A0A821VBK6_9NEOP|nr:unnamed protein product [Pieris macdunnoughi]